MAGKVVISTASDTDQIRFPTLRVKMSAKTQPGGVQRGERQREPLADRGTGRGPRRDGPPVELIQFVRAGEPAASEATMPAGVAFVRAPLGEPVVVQ